MGRRILGLLVLLGFLAGAPGAYAGLTITGTKDFQYRSFTVDGSLNQFLAEHPTFLSDRGFRQSLRLDVSGTVADGVAIEAALDDTNDIERDRKLLIRLAGPQFALTAGRLTLELPETRFLMFNKKALGIVATHVRGRHRVTAVAGRPEGASARDFFRGQGSQQEYLLRNRPVVQGSEIVHLDGRLLARGTDYDFDYQEGTLILERRLVPVEPTSTITVEYEATANGSSFPGTVLGVRERYSLERTPLTTPSRSRPADSVDTGTDHLGVSVVSQIDQDSAAAATTTTRTPQRLVLVGTDLAFHLGPHWRAGAEAAVSRLDLDSRTDGPESSGTAYELRLERQGDRWDLGVAHQTVSPRFRAIGRTEFLRLGETQDLVGDLSRTQADGRFDLTRTIFVDVSAESSRTNLDGDPARPARDFQAWTTSFTLAIPPGPGALIDGKLGRTGDPLGQGPAPPGRLPAGAPSWIDGFSGRWLGPDGKVQGRVREETDEQRPAGALAPVPVSHRVRAGSVTRRFGPLVAQLRAEEQQDRGVGAGTLAPSTADGDTRTVGASLGRSSGRTFKWDLSAQTQDVATPLGAPIRDTVTLQAFADHSPSRAWSSSLTAIHRLERSGLALSRDVIDTGEVRSTYRPSDRLTLQVKASAEQRNRILRENVRDPRLDVATLTASNGQLLPRTINADQPVVALNASQVVDWRPTKRFDHRLQYRHRDETELTSSRVLTSNRTLGYRLKFAPGTVFRSTSEVEESHAFSLFGGFERNSVRLVEELLWSLASGTNFSLTYADLDTRDRSSPLRDRTTQGLFNVEKTLDRTFTGIGRLGHTRIIQGGTSGENSIGAGLRWSPDKVDMRLQLDVDLAAIGGTDVFARELNSWRKKAGVRVDGRPGKDLNVEAAFVYEDVGPNARGETGYTSTTLETKAFINF